MSQQQQVLDRSPSASNIEDIEFFRFDEDVSDLPTALIVTNVHSSVFIQADVQEEFERVFSAFDPNKFEYFRSFRRVRISFTGPQSATQARLHCDMKLFHQQPIRCFFAQIDVPSTSLDVQFQHLSLPPLEKQFLISPPCSPPVGWEQTPESAPIINHDLLARLAHHSQPDTVHELVAQTEHSPAIVVHPCIEDSLNEDNHEFIGPRRPGKIQQTRCPARVN